MRACVCSVASRDSNKKVKQQKPPSAKRVLLRISRYFSTRILRRIDRCNCKQRDLASSRRRSRALKFISMKFLIFLLLFSSASSRDVNLACLLKTSGEKQTYFAYDLFAGVHAVAADEFLMAHNTEVKIAGFRGREN